MLVNIMLDMILPSIPYFGATAVVSLGVWGFTLRHKKFDKLMKNCGLINKDKKIPFIVQKKAGEQKTDYILSLPLGLCMKDLENQKDELSEGLHGQVEIQGTQSGKTLLTVFKGKLGTMYPFRHITEINSKPLKPVEFAVGYSHRGLLTISLQDLDPHMAIGGATNSGKSVFIKVIVTAGILKPPEQLVISLIDLKRGVEFGIFERSSRITNYAKDPESTLEVLATLKQVMNDRLDLLAKYGDIENINEYNRRFKHKKMPFHLLVIDEFTLLKFIDGAHDMVEVLLCQARAVGIHVILSLQTHHSENLPGTIKTNLGTIVSFKMRNRRHSEILLECGDAADLRGMGHGLLLAEGNLKEFQGFYIDSQTIKELIKHTYIDKKPAEPELMGVMKNDTSKKGEAIT